MLDFIRIACAVPEVKVGNVPKNVADICSFIAKADEQKVDIVSDQHLYVFDLLVYGTVGITQLNIISP
jgi:hypothetical protein